MTVIIAEKPDIAKAISKVLSGTPKWKNGYIEQDGYAITWCYGHLLTLKAPEDYGQQYARENTPNSCLPIFFENWGLKVADSGNSLLKNGSKAPDKGEQLKTIGNLLKNATSVIIAGDIDDEGQLLIEEVLEWHRYTGPCKRLDTGALNEASLKKAMANLMDNGPWHIRAVSARARTISDFVLGINGSRFFSNIYGANLSVGRVQTATLGLVVMRDEQIEGHKTLKHYVLDMMATVNGFPNSEKLRFCPDENDSHLIDGKILDKKYLEDVGNGNQKKICVAEVTKENVTEQPPLPLSISALKSYCSERFNISPEETLQITQSLRMNYGGLITYNRSECRYLPENMHSDAPSIMATIQSNLGAKWKFPGIDTQRKSKAFDDKNVGVHHAIIPTTTTADISKLSENEQKVYKAICGFYVIQFMPPAEKIRTRMTVTGDSKYGGFFESTSLALVKKGFKSVLETKKENQTFLSNIPEGKYTCELSDPVVEELETKPPKRYTDSSLENDMKNVAKYVTDPEAKKLLLLKDKDSKDEHGSIGTAATRSAIIATLKKRGFLKNEGKQVISTPLGREFYKILPDEVRKPDVTAKWWAIQQAIQDGEMTPNDMYQDVLNVFRQIAARSYPKVNLSGMSQKQGLPEVCKCPRCGMPIIETQKAFGCSGYKNGCNFVLWKEGKYGGHKVLADSKKKITTAMAKKLITNRKVVVRGLVSKKTGKTYDANLVLKDTDKGVFLELSFDGVPKKKTTKKAEE